MGYWRDASADDLNQNSFVKWETEMNLSSEDSFVQLLQGTDTESTSVSMPTARRNPQVWVKEQEDDWYTADQLVDRFGYKREALEQIFGRPTEGPNGLVGWPESTVDHIVSTVVDPAVALIKSLFERPVQEFDGTYST